MVSVFVLSTPAFSPALNPSPLRNLAELEFFNTQVQGVASNSFLDEKFKLCEIQVQ